MDAALAHAKIEALPAKFREILQDFTPERVMALHPDQLRELRPMVERFEEAMPPGSLAGLDDILARAESQEGSGADEQEEPVDEVVVREEGSREMLAAAIDAAGFEVGSEGGLDALGEEHVSKALEWLSEWAACEEADIEACAMRAPRFLVRKSSPGEEADEPAPEDQPAEGSEADGD